MVITEGEERERRTESIFKQIVDENFPTYGKNWILKFKKQTKYLIISTPKCFLQDTLY